MKRRLPLLRDLLEPRPLTGQVRDSLRRLRAVEISGPQGDGAIGMAAAAAAAIAGTTVVAGPVYSVFDEFTAAEQILASAGAGIGSPVDVGQNSVLGRFGGSVDDLAVAASRVVARLAAGNLKACTAAEIMTLLGAMDTRESNAAYVVKTGAYTATASDFIIACDTNGGAWSLKMPAAPVDGQHFIAFDYRGTWATGGKNMTFDGNGNNVNSFATRIVAIQWSIVHLHFSSAVGAWAAGRMAPI